MSKQNPNQDYYKIGGSDQTDGPDRGDSGYSQKDKPAPSSDKNPKHPAVMRSKKK